MPAPSKDPRLVAFGRRLAELRKARKLSQAELAHRAGCGSQFVSDVERGVVNPGMLALMDLARGLGVPLAELVGGSGAEAAEIDRLIGGLDVDQRKRLMAAFRAYLGSV